MGFQNYPWSSGQQALTGTPAQIVPYNAARTGLVICNTGTTDVYLVENAGGTTSTGHLLPGTKGASVAFSTTGAVYGVTGGSAATVTWLQTQ